jgi:1-acyl-sn-glycerol-3-phosphate acyltransferase
MLYKLGRTITYILSSMLFPIEVRGIKNVPKSGGFILASNHLSNLDPVVLGIACPRDLYFMAKEQLFENKIFGWIIKNCNAFPVKKGRADLAAIKEAIRLLNQGRVLLIFPEGGRQETGTLGEAEKGIGFLASKSESPIVPAFIRDTDKALPIGSKTIKRQKVYVSFGPQIFIERRMAYQDIGLKTMEAIRHLSNAQN